jgi:RNA polymerase sigma-70 factor (ECF subfamily)
MGTTTVMPPRRRQPSGAESRYCDDPEVALMLRVRDGDGDAFAELVRRYRGRVLGVFVSRLGDWQEAEDLAQEVFLRLYRSRRRYQPRARFATWLFHLSRNVARNAVRSRRHRPAQLPEALAAPADAASAALLPADRGEGPSRPLERAEQAVVVKAAVSALAARQRAAVELRHLHQRSYAEVAADLGLTLQAVKSLLSRAHNHLRDSLSAFKEAE